MDPRIKAVIDADRELVSARRSEEATVRRLLQELRSESRFLDREDELEWLRGVRAEARFVRERVERAAEAAARAASLVTVREEGPA